MECALQIYWKFGWICSHPVKSRVKKFVISPTFVLGYVSVFSLHPDSDSQPLPVTVCLPVWLYLSLVCELIVTARLQNGVVVLQ